VRSLLVAVIDDHEALCSSVVDLMRSVGYRAEPFTAVAVRGIGNERFQRCAVGQSGAFNS
jgi:FixJ family two-component response regulator